MKLKLFRASLAEDRTDRLAHFWSAAIFLTLAAIAWLLPLALRDHAPVEKPRPVLINAAPSLAEIPQYEATCWTPAEFSFAATTYSTKFCGLLFNKHLDSSNDTNLPKMYQHDPENDAQTEFKPVITREELKAKKAVVEKDYEKFYSNALRDFEKSLDEAREQNRGIQESSQSMLTVTLPLILFTLAVLLMIPHFIWSLMTAFNLDMALTTAIDSQKLNSQSRRDLMNDLIKSMSSVLNPSKARSLSTSYLLFKCLTCVIVILELVYVGTVVLPTLQNHHDQLESMTPLPVPDPGNFSMAIDSELQHLLPTQSLQELTGYGGETLICPLKMIEMQNVKNWHFQCFFKPKEDVSKLLTQFNGIQNPGQTERTRDIHTGVVPAVGKPEPESATEKNEEQLLRYVQVHETLFTAVLGYLAILACLTIFSTVYWAIRLVLGRCFVIKTLSTKFLSMDAILILTLCSENAGPVATQDLVKAIQATNGQGGSGEMQDAFV